MESSEFESYFKHFPYLKNHNIGVFSINTIPKNIKYRNFCIINTDISTGSGKHW
jgi:hypothetical protein